jgi:Cu2+-containing amine oxidase
MPARPRELVVTWNAWVGNYIYVFDWIFKLDASIESRVSATGTLLGRGAADQDEPTAPLARAAFARHPFWVTTYRDGEWHAAGDFPNQGVPGAGLPAFVSPPETLHPQGGGDDIVVWYTAVFTHIPRPEEHPVMPTESLGFRLVPHGFFARNPAPDVPDQKPASP